MAPKEKMVPNLEVICQNILVQAGHQDLDQGCHSKKSYTRKAESN